MMKLNVCCKIKQELEWTGNVHQVKSLAGTLETCCPYTHASLCSSGHIEAPYPPLKAIDAFMYWCFDLNLALTKRLQYCALAAFITILLHP